MMSSASSLLIVGILGFVFIVLVYFKIIPLDMSILFYIFSSIMFAAFIIAGIVSFFKAGKIKSTISSENQLLTRIKIIFGMTTSRLLSILLFRKKKVITYGPMI